MSLNMFWFLPTHGDGHYLGTEEGSRPVDHGYLQQIAQAADRLGYTGVLIPTGRSCEDAWLVAASMIPVTQRLKFLVALRPSVTSPTVAARQAATLDRLSNGRALFNLVTGSDPQELAGDGVFLDHSERYEASAEFTQVWRRLLLGETVNFNGNHIHVRGAKLLFPPIQQPYPPLYFGGSSDVAQELAAEQVDLYLTWGEPPELVKEKIEQVRAKAAAHGRKIRFGIRLHVIVRETNDEAWQAAERLISHLDDETIAKAQAAFARTDSVGQQRMAALHNGKRDNLEISPSLWGRWLSARRCRDGTGGRWSDGRCANQRIRRAWHRQLCAFGLPASGRSVSGWRVAVPASGCCHPGNTPATTAEPARRSGSE